MLLNSSCQGADDLVQSMPGHIEKLQLMNVEMAEEDSIQCSILESIS